MRPSADGISLAVCIRRKGSHTVIGWLHISFGSQPTLTLPPSPGVTAACGANQRAMPSPVVRACHTSSSVASMSMVRSIARSVRLRSLVTLPPCRPARPPSVSAVRDGTAG